MKEKRIGKIGERLFEKKCKKLNIAFKRNKNKPALYNYLINGLRVEVATSNISQIGKAIWSFEIGGCHKKTKNDFDILVGIVLFKRHVFWIIPNKEIKQKKGIGFYPLRARTENTSYLLKFRNRWDFFR